MSQTTKALKPYEPGRDPLTGYVTRDGRKVRILATDLEGKFPIAAGVMVEPGYEGLWSFTDKGRQAAIGGAPDSNIDLMCAPERRTVWVNVYPKGAHRIGFSSGYPCRADADHGADKDRIACIEVTFTEGEGL